LPSVLHILYLIFNEGYTSSSGRSLHRVELTAEAIRLTRELHATLPEEGEVTGLLALMLLTDARRPARTRPGGALVPLAEQDRALWNQAYITEGIELITSSLATASPGPFQLQAAIAAVHDEAPRAEDTDWPQILALYDLLATLAPGPMVTLNRIVAAAMVRGPAVALAHLDAAAGELAPTGHRADAVRAHLLDELGEHDAARDHYRRAARLTLSLPEQRYLLSRATGGPRGVASGSGQSVRETNEAKGDQA
jgi:predicted RNA polymerase sigma factor